MKIRESDIRADIAYFEAKVNENAPAATAEQRHLCEHYMRFVERRVQLLAAFLDGRPEAWQEYPGRCAKLSSNDRISGKRTTRASNNRISPKLPRGVLPESPVMRNINE
jgi:hypothetical protein